MALFGFTANLNKYKIGKTEYPVRLTIKFQYSSIT